MTIRRVALLCCVLIITGCVNISKESPVVNKYLFSPKAPVAVETDENAFNIKVRSFNVDDPFDGRAFIYRLGDNRFEQDYYHQFSAFPATLLTQQVVERLKKQPFIAYVSRERDQVDCMYEIRGSVTALYGDFRSARTPKAYMLLHLTVFDTSSYPLIVVLDKDYSHSHVLSDTKPPTLIRGWEKCFDVIIEAFAEDLRKKQG